MVPSQPCVPQPSVKDALNHGNIEFVEFLRREQDAAVQNGNAQKDGLLNRIGRLGEIPSQRPAAAVLSCSDARVPVLQLFQKQPNEIFEIRLAGNVASRECLGSLLYAIEHLPSLEGVAVLGHTGCGAVAATVDQYLSQVSPTNDDADPIFSLVKHILFSVDVGAAAMALSSLTGHSRETGKGLDRQTLIDVAVFVNAAATAWKIQQFLQDCSRTLPVLYGVYDLASCRVLHADLERQDGSLLFGLGSAPSAVEVNEVAKILVKNLDADEDHAGQFTLSSHSSPSAVLDDPSVLVRKIG